MIDMLYKYMYCTVQSSWRRGLVVFDDMMKMKLLYIQFRKKKKKKFILFSPARRSSLHLCILSNLDS